MRLAVKNGICCSVLVAMSLLASAAAAEAPITDEARQHFNAGVAHMQDPDGARYAEAYQEFLAAYAASPSWKILGNLGIAAMKLERDGEAIDAFARYLQEGGEQIDSAEREQITRDMNTLKASLATLSIETIPAGATIVDERVPATGTPIVNRYGPVNGPTAIGAKAGKHRITAELDGHDKAVWEIDLQPASNHSYRFELQKTAPAPVADGGGVGLDVGSTDRPASSGLRVASYAALGVGVIGLAGGTYFALSAKSKSDEAKDMCGGSLSACKLDEGSSEATKVSELNDQSGTNKTLGVVGFVVGGVGVAAGVTMFILSAGGSKKAATSVQKPASSVSVVPWIGYNSAGVVGQF